LIFIVILVIWEALAQSGIISVLFFPAPSTILRTLFLSITEGSLSSHFFATVSRVLLGFATGGLTGLLLGIVLGRSQRLRSIIDPFVAAFHPIPKIAILPLFMIIFGIGETSKVVVIAFTAFFPMVINTLAGVRQINPLYFDVAKNYGASRVQVFKRVIIPGSMPMILAGMRLALNTSLIVAIAIELVTAQRGLGALIWQGWETLRTEVLYVSLAVTSVLGIGMNLIIQYATKLLVPWYAGGGNE
jgi:NitT/TauT family transport system permease protein